MTLSRRAFVTGLSTSGALLALPSALRAGAASETLNIAAIGVGGRGWADVNAAVQGHRLVAFCDVQTGPTTRKGGFAAAAEKWPKARRYQDWRKLLDESRDIDAITVSTPDHMHAAPTLTAMRMGKHVFTQKPLTHTVHEARTLMVEARRLGVATQMGIQNQSTVGHRKTAALVRAGLVGKIREVHCWSHKGWAGPKDGRPRRTDPIPKGLDWDLWLGVAPDRPYADDIYQPMKWRGWLDFGSGTLGDMGIHVFEPTFSALALAAPLSVKSLGMPPNQETWQPKNTIEFEFRGNELTSGDTLPLVWRDGSGNRPSASISKHLDKDVVLPRQATLFIGEKGALVLPHGGDPMVFPEELLRGFEVPTIERRGHFEDWHKSIRSGKPACASFDFSAPLTESVLLGSIAVRFPNEKLSWDSETLVFSNKPEANEFVRSDYRRGWEVEGL